MLPHLLEWKRWGAIERISYITQIVTIASFASASWFSYQSWQEAKIAREDQRRFFVEEKAPDLVVASARKLDGASQSSTILQLTIKNQGLSEAKISDLEIAVEDEYRPDIKISLYSAKLNGTRLGKGRELNVLATLKFDSKNTVRWSVESLRLYGVDDRRNYDVIARIKIKYEGRFGDTHMNDFEIVADNIE